MKVLFISIVVYFIFGICYAIDFFHNDYDNMVENEGVTVGEFFALTVFIGLLWPLFIIAFAIMDVRGDR